MNITALTKFVSSHNLHTPVMFFDESAAEKAIKLMCENLPNADIYFAVKSCYNLNLLRFFASHDLGAEVMSELEFNLAEKTKFKRIILNGLGRSEQCILKALKHKNTTLIVDSERDLNLVKQYLKEHKNQHCRLGIRLRFDYDENKAAKNQYLKHLNKLGNYVDSDFYTAFLDYVRHEKRAIWDIVHMHFTINELNSDTYVEAMKFLHEHLLHIKQQYNLMPQRIDLGGGIEVYSAEYETCLKKMFATIASEFSKLFTAQKLVMEPGRFLSACAGYVLGKVTDIKKIKTKKWLFTDIGTNVMIPNTNGRYKLLYPHPDNRGEHIGITDGITSGVNNIVEDLYLNQPLQIGDFLIIGNAGAYTDVYSTFWGYDPFTVCYVFKSGKIKITRSQEDINILRKVFFP